VRRTIRRLVLLLRRHGYYTARSGPAPVDVIGPRAERKRWRQFDTRDILRNRADRW